MVQGAALSSNIHWITRERLECLATMDAAAWKWKAESEQIIESLGPAELDETYELWRAITQLSIPRSLNRPELVKLGNRQMRSCARHRTAGKQGDRLFSFFRRQREGRCAKIE